MRTASFSYNLPPKLIAQHPVKPRDRSRLLVLRRNSKKLEHLRFDDLPKLLRPDDVLVFNNSKVFKARLIGRKLTGGKIEVFLLRLVETRHFASLWEVLIGGRGGNVGLRVNFGKKLSGEIIEKQDSIRLMRFNLSGKKLNDAFDKLGSVPLPPYIKSSAKLDEYQTVYAKTRGSVAAPTAGLHFTKRLLQAFKKKGIKLEYVTLHVGLGTFAPIKTEKIEDHKIHSEWASIDSQTARRLNQYKKQGRRIIAVGTTTVRTLESFNNPSSPRTSPPFQGGVGVVPGVVCGTRDVNLYITPGYKFKFIDAMITNFHLPQSSLLVLVSTFTGHKKIMAAYQAAIKKKYRFYSFGDAMLIL